MAKNFLIIFFLFQSFFAFAQIGAKSAFEFARIPSSARTIALGGYLPANQLTNDLSVAVYTPSLLNKKHHQQININHQFMFAGIQNGQAAMAFYNNKYNATLAASIQYVNYGKFTRTDENGNKQGNFSGNDIAMQVGFGKTLNKYFSYGANAKFLASYLDNLLATAVAIDLSTTYADTAKRISISLLIKNAGVQLKGYQPRYYNDESFTETVPTDIQIGITKRLKHLPFSLNVAAHHLYKWDIRYDNPADRITNTIVGADTVAAKTYFADKLFRHMVFGGEFYFGKSLSIQLGYNHLRRQELKTSTRNGLVGFSCGFHFKTNRFTIGYAHAWYYLPSATNTLALSFHL